MLTPRVLFQTERRRSSRKDQGKICNRNVYRRIHSEQLQSQKCYGSDVPSPPSVSLALLRAPFPSALFSSRSDVARFKRRSFLQSKFGRDSLQKKRGKINVAYQCSAAPR